MTGQFLTVTEFVNRRGRSEPHEFPEAGWVVAATFIAEGSAEPRCVDYHVRALPHRSDFLDQLRVRNAVHDQVASQLMGVDEIEALGEFPPGGIPGFVFQEASQARLLDIARARVASEPAKYEPIATEILRRVPVSRSGKMSRGRPRARTTGETLAILLDVETSYAAGETRARVAERHHMSDSSLRDLLYWARKVSEPALFTDPGRGKRGGRLTPEARALLGGVDHE